MHYINRVTFDEPEISGWSDQRRNIGSPGFMKSSDNVASDKPVRSGYQYFQLFAPDTLLR